MKRCVTKQEKERARELAAKSIRQIVDAAQVLADVRPDLAAEQDIANQKTTLISEGVE